MNGEKRQSKTEEKHNTNKKNGDGVPAFGVINLKGVFARLTPNPSVNLSFGAYSDELC